MFLLLIILQELVFERTKLNHLKGTPKIVFMSLLIIMYLLLNGNNLDVNRLNAAKMSHCQADQVGVYLRFLPYFGKNAEKMTFRKGLV